MLKLLAGVAPIGFLFLIVIGITSYEALRYLLSSRSKNFKIKFVSVSRGEFRELFG
jgi:hypothetical protein